MSGILGFHTREAVRVKVKKCEGNQPPEYRKFSVDPQITSFEVLQNLLARAFDIKGEFTISYLARDDEGKETYLGLLSDWDLDAAFLSSSDPCLQLKVELKPFEEAGLEEWDIITPADLPKTEAQVKPSLTGTFLIQMEKTLNRFQKVLNLAQDSVIQNDIIHPLKDPMGDREFHNYLDGEGRLIHPKELRLSVYRGGVEASLRKVVWKHILNVYPDGLSGKERIAYMKQKSNEYYRLRNAWQDMIASGNVTEEMQFVTNMVRKDVLRTDRTHKFYAGSDDNKNVVSLFNILTTFALNHPSVSYCQGMSDLASPILVTMKDEAHAYVCFCALMQRLKPNFNLDGEAMTLKFQHLSELLQHFDPHFYEYLRQRGADDLLFCYRWLLLELKREFAFDDALRMLEVLWSSIPPCPPKDELPLFEEEFSAETASPQSPRLHSRENPYTKVRAIRKQNSATSINIKSEEAVKKDVSSSVPSDVETIVSENCTSPKTTTSRRSSETECESTTDDSQEYFPITTSITRELRIELDNLNRHLPGSHQLFQKSFTFDSEDPDSPLSQNSCKQMGDGCCRKNDPQKQCTDADAEDDAMDYNSWTSDDLSAGEHIHRVKLKLEKSLMLNGGVNNYFDSTVCCTPDEQCDLDFDDQDKSFGSEPNCNGEILENEETIDSSGEHYPCHLKSIIPIHLVHSPVKDDRRHRYNSDGSDSSSENCDASTPFHLIAPSNNTSEGYGSEGTMSSKETSTQEEVGSHMFGETHSVMDSGVIEPLMNSCEDALEFSRRARSNSLPPPHALGGGNPFMMFLCLTLLLQHREVIMRNNMDYNELAMHFDKMVRKHNVQRVLHQTRTMFSEYLRMGWQEDSWEGTSNLQV